MIHTENYNMTLYDDTIICDGTFSVALFPAIYRVRQRCLVKNIGTGVITVTSTDTIDGESSVTIDGGESLEFQSIPTSETTANYILV